MDEFFDKIGAVGALTKFDIQLCLNVWPAVTNHCFANYEI